MINSLRDDLEKGTSILQVTRSMLDRSGYVKALIEEHSAQSLSRRDNIVELQNAIAYYEKSSKNPSLSVFLQEISLITNTDKYDETKPAVTMMTVHGSKGLEFPVVFVVGLEENLFPVGGRNGEEPDIEEERRLFYVAITRAEKKLFFSTCRMRYRFGEETHQARSRFLDEVDPGVVRTEAGATILQNKDRFTDTDDNGPDDSVTIEYDWRSPVSGNKKASTATSDYTYEYDNDPFQTGVKVMHPRFGKGKILSRTGYGDDSKVVVFFKNRGRKTLMLKAANLQIVQ